jgi:RHS repeat-associated protein
VTANSGVDAQVLTLPNGGGAVTDLGSTFETDLNTGTGSYTLSLRLPAGPNAVLPKIDLRYHTGAGNGPFGMGWTLGALSIARQTDRQVPTYAPGDDAFVIPGVENLVDLGGGLYRPRVDSHFYRIRRLATGWEITDTRGTVHLLGLSAASQVLDDSGPAPRVAQWLLESSTDPNGEAIRYSYLADGTQRYLQRVEWGTYALEFNYQPRPDVLVNGRNGFLVPTAQRCPLIELHVTTITLSLARSWTIDYLQAPGSGLSLIEQITMRGHAADGTSLAAPPVTLGYRTAAPRTLQRLTGPFPGAGPGAISGGKTELVDWDGDGLPDLFELRGGVARIWPNTGRGRLGYPQDLPRLPSPVNLDQPGLAWADMEGSGTADLLCLTGPFRGYWPLQPGGGFARPVRFSRAPAPGLASGAARLVDLDGDGRTDVLVTSRDFVSLYLREPEGGNQGWSERPQTIPASDAPPAPLQDHHVRLADMTGDGLQDLVRVDGAGITYWPYLGHGRWADPVRMAHPPALGSDYDPQRLSLVDIDGDGCCDLVYVGPASVTFWYNRGGLALSDPQEIRYVPGSKPGEVRLCDFNGSGTLGVLWSNVPNGPVERGYVYLDLMGGTKPYLLDRIDNGLGLRTTISYRSSTEYAIDAADAGQPWRTFHPFPVQCVAGMRLEDLITGQVTSTSYQYHEARYDQRERQFLGFAVVDTVTDGDASIPTQRTRNTYHLGVDPADPTRPLTPPERDHFGALRRRMLSTELYGEDATPDAVLPYRIVRHAYATRVDATGLDGTHVMVPFETETVEESWERQAAPYAIRTIEYLDVDAFGNITKQRLRAQRTGHAQPDQDITTDLSFAQNLAAHIVSLPARVTQHDPDGTVISDMLSFYDGDPHVGLPLGTVTTGNLTRTEALMLLDATATAVYGAQQPNWEALHYHRLPGESGWWATKVSYERRLVGGSLSLISRDARGSQTQIDFDPTRQYPLRTIDPLGNVTSATIDERALQMSALTDPNGATTTDTFDALGRVTHTVAPLDSAALPSITFEYQTQPGPVRIRIHTRTAHGGPDLRAEVDYFDGHGQCVARVGPGEQLPGRTFIVQGQVRYNARGFVADRFVPYYLDSDQFPALPQNAAHSSFTYDALGRAHTETRANELVRSTAYGPGTTVLTEQFTGAATARSVTEHLDAIGRVERVERPVDGRTIAMTYTYDSTNRLITSTDPDEAVTRFTYDTGGRLLVDEHTDTGRTVNVVDAAGNQIERRSPSGRTVIHDVDALARVTSIRAGHSPADATTASPEVRFHYLDTGTPDPADGVRFRRGRLWKVEDAIGSVTQAYDDRGRIIQSRRTVAALADRELVTDFELDAVGRLKQVTLPAAAAAAGSGRRVVRYQYNARGLPLAAAGYVKSAEYDVFGRMTRQVLQNGAQKLYDFEPFSGRPTRLRVVGPANEVLRDQTFTYDDTGNVARIDSPLALEAGQFTYDSADRLVGASYGDGATFAYNYTDGGNLTSVPTLGALTYRAPGSGQVTAAGGHPYAYDTDGNMTSHPSGALGFDAFGRLATITPADSSPVHLSYDFMGMQALKRDPDGTLTIAADPNIDLVGSKAIVWISFGGHRVAGVLDDGPAFYEQVDVFGNVSLILDSAGAVLRRIGFGPYGTIRSDTATAGAPPGAPRYDGGTTEAISGLVCLGRRWYDPSIGRFCSADIIIPGVFDLEGWNRYCYARGNPLRYRDPSGALSVGDWFAIIGIAILVIALCVAAYFTGGLTLTLIPGLTASLSGILVATAVGVAGGAIVGGIAAAQAGGDIWAGVLLGGFIGGVSAFVGAYLSAGVLGLMGGAAKAGLLGGAAVGAIQGAFVGAGTGAAVGFAGGKGTAEGFWKHVLVGAITGAITGALLGAFFSQFDKNSALKLGTLDKFSIPHAAAEGTKGELNWFDNFGSSVQDMSNWINEGPNPSGFTEFIDIGNDSTQTFQICGNGSLVSIPMGWIPTVAVPYGGIGAATQISLGLDAFGALSWEKQVLYILNAAPFVGIILGYGIGEGSDWENGALDWVHKNLSMQSLPT